jgi:AraC family transcriptional regulator
MTEHSPRGQGPAQARPNLAAINATVIETLWGRRAKAKSEGASGLSAALWDSNISGWREISRPACDQTHVISIWTQGSAYSELDLADKPRFKSLRRPGTFQLARAGESVRAVLNNTSGSCLDIYVPTDLLAKCLEEEHQSQRGALEILPLGLERDPLIASLGDLIASEIQHGVFASRVALDSATALLAMQLIRRWSNQAGRARPPTGGLAPWQARRATDYVRQHMSEDISLAELASVVRLSPFHFARAFKTSVGKPPHAYLNSIRIERALVLLRETEATITDIAHTVGYDTLQTFSRAFRRECGLTAGQYRRSCRG